jgi:hypothetical protein
MSKLSCFLCENPIHVLDLHQCEKCGKWVCRLCMYDKICKKCKNEQGENNG